MAKTIFLNSDGAPSVREIHIGQSGENLFREIVFDVSKFTADSEYTYAVVFGRPDGYTSVPVALIEDDRITWHPSLAETEIAGDGYVEIHIIGSDGILLGKSLPVVCHIHASICGSETPDPLPPWVDEAVVAAKRASESATSAEEAAVSASNSAEAAEEAATHYPYIRETDKHWMVWDVAAGEYTDTGVVAEGQDGASSWDDLTDKPFERLGDTLKVENGTLDINIYETTNPQGGSTLIIGQ